MDRLVPTLVLASTVALFQLPVSQALDSRTEKSVRAATFELLARGPTAEAESLVGTAFAIGPNEFATAAHLLDASIGSSFGHPEVMDSHHASYRIKDILQFSEQQDYAVFSLENPPAVQPLPILHVDPAASDLYFAGWQAQRKVVIGRGAFSGMTRDEESREFDWLRFSGPVWSSAGGGPLLDQSGHVVGIIQARAKDAGANYAVPIGLLPVGAPGVARIHATEMLRALMPAVWSVEPLKAEIPLPMSFDEFANELQQLRLEYIDRMISPLVESTHGNFVLIGAGAEDVCNLLNGSACQCKGRAGVSGRLVLDDNSHTDEAVLHVGRGDDISMTVAGVAMVRSRGAPHNVGRQAIPTGRYQFYTDFHDRTWSMQTWSLGHHDQAMVSLSRTLPDGGHVVLTRTVPTALTYAAVLQVKFVANLVYYGCDELPIQGIAQVAENSAQQAQWSSGDAL
jgi:serine protease Do